MVKHVYKITNKINGKIYIGQTNNLKRRIQEHKHDKRRDKYLYRAIKKYGWDSFTVDILYYGENYNEEEKKWIEFYDSRNREKGYNITEGGQDSSGESNPASILTQNIVDEVIELLQNTDKTCEQISHVTNVSLKNIYNINSGVVWMKNDINYPIRNLTNRLSKQDVDSIYNLLLNTELTYEEIAQTFNLKPYNICSINNGKSYKKDNYDYPLRDVNKHSKEIAKTIIKMLSDTDLKFKDISEITGKSISVISKINSGKSWVDESVTYPIRSYK